MQIVSEKQIHNKSKFLERVSKSITKINLRTEIVLQTFKYTDPFTRKDNCPQIILIVFVFSAFAIKLIEVLLNNLFFSGNETNWES